MFMFGSRGCSVWFNWRLFKLLESHLNEWCIYSFTSSKESMNQQTNHTYYRSKYIIGPKTKRKHTKSFKQKNNLCYILKILFGHMCSVLFIVCFLLRKSKWNTSPPKKPRLRSSGGGRRSDRGGASGGAGLFAAQAATVADRGSQQCHGFWGCRVVCLLGRSSQWM